mmetsp:Transcript_2012/g.8014  ORF Transcript_2012/g.8014 Transcript_2012/m.8014 type:complete len:326 (+) Transcript_2012:560-1537(+)
MRRVGVSAFDVLARLGQTARHGHSGHRRGLLRCVRRRRRIQSAAPRGRSDAGRRGRRLLEERWRRRPNRGRRAVDCTHRAAGSAAPQAQRWPRQRRRRCRWPACGARSSGYQQHAVRLRRFAAQCAANLVHSLQPWRAAHAPARKTPSIGGGQPRRGIERHLLRAADATSVGLARPDVGDEGEHLRAARERQQRGHLPRRRARGNVHGSPRGDALPARAARLRAARAATLRPHRAGVRVWAAGRVPLVAAAHGRGDGLAQPHHRLRSHALLGPAGLSAAVQDEAHARCRLAPRAPRRPRARRRSQRRAGRGHPGRVRGRHQSALR